MISGSEKINANQNDSNYQDNLNYFSDDNTMISFSCSYLVEDTNKYIRLINDRFENYVNSEISSKIKILNGNKKEKLIFQKKFNKTGIYKIDYIIEGTIHNMAFMFNECSSLKQIEFFSCDTSKVIDMGFMFSLCNELEYADLSVFDTSNVLNMHSMFYGCMKLKAINGIENFNTANVVDMRTMFLRCEELEYLDLSSFNTSNVLICMLCLVFAKN